MHAHFRRAALYAALAFTTAIFTLVLPASQAQAQCAAAIRLCSKSAAKLGNGAEKTIDACEEVRECREECKDEKRSVVGECRGDKGDCREDCRKRFRVGADFQRCAANCRQDKRSCAQDARQDKRACRQVCRSTFLTPACTRARLKVVGSSLKTIAACATLASCVKPLP